MEWSDLRIFLAIARAGTLGAAARRIGLTQPTMGRRLRALEQALGQTLFQRSSDGFILTDEGQSVLQHAERIEEESLAVERLAAGGAQLQGQIRIASSDWFGVHVLTPILAAFAKEHPGMGIELITDQRPFSLARREADLAFRIAPFDEPEIVQRKCLHMDYALYAPRGMAVPSLGDGAGLVLVTMDAAFGTLPDMAWLRRRLPKARIAFRSNNRDVQAQACLEGVGLAVLPRLLGDSLPGLEAIALDEARPGTDIPGRDVWVGYHRDLKRVARLRTLLDFVLQRLA
ncbi:LysR family transcriptional regulator [Dongia sp.]|uniref:LysR family transcriptional regulator n=1 Tax=Dongia sp. TaxID=1977262 RepID=UPI0035ADF410